MLTDLQIEIQKAIDEDWELVKDTAGAHADRRTLFDLAFRFGWHAATKPSRMSGDEHECDGMNCPPRAHDHKVLL